MVNYKLVLVLFISFVCMSACRRNDVLDQQQLENILFEMQLHDGVLHTLAQNTERQDVNKTSGYQNIFAKYNCSRDKFEKSLRWYSRQKETINKIYENLKRRFDEMLKQYEGKTLWESAKSIGNDLITPINNLLLTVQKTLESNDMFNNLLKKTLTDTVENNKTANPVFRKKRTAK